VIPTEAKAINRARERIYNQLERCDGEINTAQLLGKAGPFETWSAKREAYTFALKVIDDLATSIGEGGNG
jgi:hypothetical protein